MNYQVTVYIPVGVNEYEDCQKYLSVNPGHNLEEMYGEGNAVDRILINNNLPIDIILPNTSHWKVDMTKAVTLSGNRVLKFFFNISGEHLDDVLDEVGAILKHHNPHLQFLIEEVR